MADIKTYPFVRQLRSDAANHMQKFRNGRRVRSGRGLAFWFMPDGASIFEIPMDDRDLPFLFNSRSKDFQEVTAQGVVVWRVADPELLGERVDFSIDLRHGHHQRQPVDQIDALLTGLSQQFAAQYLQDLTVAEILAKGVKPLHQTVEAGLAGSARLAEMGLAVVSVRIADISPTSELKRALQTPTFERLQQQADQATFERRALAVEKERAIAENELQNRIELAGREKELIEREDANARNRAMAEVAAAKISADGEAERIRTIEQASADMERARIDIYRELPPSVMLGLAAQSFAEKMGGIEHLNITPDVLTLISDAFGGGGKLASAKR